MSESKKSVSITSTMRKLGILFRLHSFLPFLVLILLLLCKSSNLILSPLPMMIAGTLFIIISVCKVFLFSQEVTTKISLVMTIVIEPVASLAVIILSSAILYHQMGVIDANGDIVKEFGVSLYFSIVTFTTLGYGDFRPTEAARGIAALEAIIGFICLGLLIGTTIHLLQNLKPKFLQQIRLKRKNHNRQ